MCFARGIIGGDACDYNVSIFRVTDGRSLGHRWVRRSPPSAIGETREFIAQLIPRADGDVQLAINLSAAAFAPQPTKVNGWRIEWTAPETGFSSINSSLNNAMALLSGDRTAFSAGNGNNSLHCYDPDGNELWSVPAPGGGDVLYPTIATDGTDVFGTYRPSGDVLYGICYSGDDGSELWRTILGAPVSGGADVIGAVDGDVLAIGNVTGGNIWRFNSSGVRVGSGVVGTSQMFVSKRVGGYVWGGGDTFPSVFVGDTDLAPVVSIDMQPDITAYSIPIASGFAEGPRAVWVDASGVYATLLTGSVLKYDLAGVFQWWNRCYMPPGSSIFTNDMAVIGERLYVVHEVVSGEFKPDDPLPP